MVQNTGCLHKNMVKNDQFTANYSLDVYLTLSHFPPPQELRMLFCGHLIWLPQITPTQNLAFSW